MEALEKDHDDKHEDRLIQVFVNERPVLLEGKKHTGLDIKAAAVAQGVSIGPDFILSLERGHGHTEIIGDHERVTVKKGDRFLAIPNDDNS